MPITLNGSTGVTYPDGVLQTSGVPAPGTAGNVLTSNGTIWTSAAAAAFDAGTRMMFAQTSAPTGWTKDTTNYNNHTLRVVTGAASTGGTVDFTTAFASQTPTITTTAGTLAVSTAGLSVGSTTLSTAQMPSHSHNTGVPLGFGGCNIGAASGGAAGAPDTSSTGGGGSHNHSLSGSASLSGSPSSTSSAINLAVKYLDVITATKN
jgi:hypothetical protein